MTETPQSRQRRLPIQHAAAPVGGVLVMLVLIWALTGARYFWPIWPAIGFWMLLGIPSAIHWSKTLPAGGRRGWVGQLAWTGVLWVGLIAIWGAAGFHYFWPVWPIMGTSIPLIIRAVAGGRQNDELEVRVDELQRTRSGVLDVQANEMRRIERDLHDGAQARLVALSMKLGRAEARYGDDEAHPEIAELLRDAREQTTAAIRELRDLSRGIAPPILTDRGLEAAVTSLADRTPGKVTVTASLPMRPIPAVENAAYFVVAESLTNATKHAPGAAVEITLTQSGNDLVVEVLDFGQGGANPAGNGLTGLRQRVEALDGRLMIVSPAGVGTQVEAVLPCAS